MTEPRFCTFSAPRATVDTVEALLGPLIARWYAARDSRKERGPQLKKALELFRSAAERRPGPLQSLRKSGRSWCENSSASDGRAVAGRHGRPDREKSLAHPVRQINASTAGPVQLASGHVLLQGVMALFVRHQGHPRPSRRVVAVPRERGSNACVSRCRLILAVLTMWRCPSLLFCRHPAPPGDYLTLYRPDVVFGCSSRAGAECAPRRTAWITSNPYLRWMRWYSGDTSAWPWIRRPVAGGHRATASIPMVVSVRRSFHLVRSLPSVSIAVRQYSFGTRALLGFIGLASPASAALI